MLKPDACFNKNTDIEVSFLKENSIKGLSLDLDNTLIDLEHNFIEGIKDWIDNIKDNNIKICIATNSISKNKIAYLAEQLDVPYVYVSLKPLKFGLKKAIKILELKNNEIAEIGDQLFTDVWLSNRMHIYSILTKPVSKDRFKIDKLKRKIEKWYLTKDNNN